MERIKITKFAHNNNLQKKIVKLKGGYLEGNYLFLLANELLLKSQHESSESSIWHFSSLIQFTDFCFYNGKQTWAKYIKIVHKNWEFLLWYENQW